LKAENGVGINEEYARTTAELAIANIPIFLRSFNFKRPRTMRGKATVSLQNKAKMHVP